MRKSTRGPKASRDILAADFETTTNPDDCRVWGFGVASISNPSRVAATAGAIQDFMGGIERGRPSIVYFHNLKFDGAFILDWLLRTGHTQHTNDERPLIAGEFDLLMSDTGAMYSITWKPFSGGSAVEFRDFLKKMPFSVAQMGKMYGRITKGDLDYDAYRAPDHVLTSEERDYIQRDVEILATAVADVYAKGAIALTIGSDVLADFKRMTGPAYDSLFPRLGAELARDIRASYRGGWVYCNPLHKGRVRGMGRVFDVNSLYPYVMYEKDLPYGEPIPLDGMPPNDGLWIATVEFMAKLKSGMHPAIQVSGGLTLGAEYAALIDEPMVMCVTSVDWELFNELYDITVLSWFGGWKFRSDNTLFRSYIDKWMEVKESTTGPEREWAKLHLNSLYGKFGASTFGRNKIAVWDEEKNMPRLESSDMEQRTGVYVPMACFITAYARAHTIREAVSAGERFAYADTDSIHLVDRWDDVRPRRHSPAVVHPTRMGAWKMEYRTVRSLVVRPKGYIEETREGGVVARFAGVPRGLSSQLSISALTSPKSSFVITGKLVPKRVPGGVVLVERPYTIDVSDVLPYSYHPATDDPEGEP